MEGAETAESEVEETPLWNEKLRLIQRMLLRGMSPEDVADIVEVPAERLYELLEEHPLPDGSDAPESPASPAKEESKDQAESTRPPSPVEVAPVEPVAVAATAPPPPRAKVEVKAAGIPAYRRRGLRPQSAPCRAPTAAEVGLNMRRVQLFVFQWKRRTKDFFQDFNLLNLRRCTRDQFRRGLTNLLHPRCLEDTENPVDAEVIMDYFEAFPRMPGQPRQVDVQRFCDEVELVFTKHYLEKSPLKPVPAPGFEVEAWKGFQPKAPRDPGAYEQLLLRIRVLCQARGIDLATCLDDTYWSTLDAKAGRLRPDHFLRAFPLTRSTPTVGPAISAEEMQPVLERFTDIDGFFRIFLFQNEVEEVVQAVARAPAPHASTSPGFPLQRYPRPHSARVSSTRASIYQEPGGRTASRPQTARPLRPVAPEAPPARRRPHTAVVRAKPELMTTLKSFVLTNRVRLWDSFQDFDRLRRGTVQQTGFLHGLTTMGLRLGLAEMTELYDRYKTPEGHFCYHDFCMDMDDSVRSQIEKNMAAAGAADEKSLHMPLVEDDEKILKKVHEAMARYVKARGLDVISIFENYKKAGQSSYGHVLLKSFWRAMDDINVKSVAQNDLVVLCKAYCDTESGKEFNYLNFCAMVDPMNSRLPGALLKRPAYKRRVQSYGRTCERQPLVSKMVTSRYINRPITMVG